MRVLVVDDHDLFRTGLATLLGLQPDMEDAWHKAKGMAKAKHADKVRTHRDGPRR